MGMTTTTPMDEIMRSPALLAELWNLHHLARTALAYQNPDWLGRASWACAEFNKLHPEFNAGAAYKALDRTRTRTRTRNR